MAKIIDFKKKGNVVRFYLGDDNCNNYYGDDWDNSPYDCNAGSVYDEFVIGIVEVAFPFSYTVLEPCESSNKYNCPYRKEDMKNRDIPCIIAVPENVAERCMVPNFDELVGSDRIIKFYFGDSADSENVQRWRFDKENS